MSTDVIAPPSRTIHFLNDGFGIEPRVYAGKKGKKVYSGVAVFRSGTFRDSMGQQNTWEDLHIKQMLDNYNFLTNKKIVDSVPVRDGHQAWLVGNIPGRGEVVGWHTDLVTKRLKSPVDNTEYEYLLADYEITQDYAEEKIQSGTWRNRSSEIGFYTTNNETELWPVYLGFAWVDFPAVEGLNFSLPTGDRFFAFVGNTHKETVVTSPAPTTAPVLPLQTPASHSAPAQPPAQATQAPQPFVFSMNGQNVTDYNQVQQYITRLEGFIAETREAGRKSFVSGLVKDNKITVAQQDGQTAFALSLSDEQYDSWTKNWNTAPTAQILGQHASGVSNSNNSAQSGTQPDALQTARDIVKMHERNNMPLETLKATASYKALVAANEKPA